jgi:hypothetical protein
MTIPVGASALKIDAETGDLVIEDGDFVWVSGLDAIEQDIRTALLMFQGEWFLDLTAGIPYHQSILGQKTPLPVVREIFRQQLLAIPGVLEVLTIEASFNSQTRRLTVTWKVSTDLGELTGELTQ